MLLSLLLSLLIDTNRLSILGLKIRGETNILSIRLKKEVLFRIIEGIIARLFIVERIVIIGIPIIRKVLIGVIESLIIT